MTSIRPARKLIAIAAVVTMLASCAQPEKIAAPAATSHVTGVGKVTLHAGQPCASQVMFDFRITGARAIVQLAAPMRETKVLTEAANRNRSVRIWGEWGKRARARLQVRQRHQSRATLNSGNVLI